MEVSKIIILEIRVIILATQVETMLGMVSIIGQQIEIRETYRTEIDIRFIAVVVMCPQAIETGRVVVLIVLRLKI